MSAGPGDVTADRTALLRGKTGRGLEEWFAVIRESKLGRHGEILALLKHQHGVSHSNAYHIALTYCRQIGPGQARTDPADAMYTGPKGVLRPIHDALMNAVQALGPEVAAIPKKGYFSLRRSRQFAIVQPSGTNHIDLGLNLSRPQAEGRLERSNGFSVMVTHRVRISSVAEVDDELKQWLAAAFRGA